MTEPHPKPVRTSSSSSLPLPSCPIIILEKDGDVLSTVTSADQKSTKTFLAQSSILRIASLVFATLYYGPFKEATELKRDGKVEIKLEEDGPDAMELILRVLHHKMDGVELHLPLEKVVKIAVQADSVTVLVR